MSDEQDTPVWHAIVGEGWRPVQFGEETRQDDEVLDAGGWRPCCVHQFSYARDSMPRRRRKHSWEILLIKDGVSWFRVKAVKPGDYFMVAENGELVPIEVEE
jgi:hypothetical protein